MPTTIETDLKEVLGEIKQQLNEIQSDITDLKIHQAEIRGELGSFKAEIKGELGSFKAEVKGEFSTIKSELSFIREDLKDLRGNQRSQIWALIITVIGATVAAVVKFGFLSSP